MSENSRIPIEPNFPPSISRIVAPYEGDLKNHIRSSKFHKNGDSVGVALLSSYNLIPSMRALLSALFNDMVRANSEHGEDTRFYLDATADLLYLSGKNEKLLQSILQDYSSSGENPWVDQSLNSQTEICEAQWDNMLLNTLSPVALAHIFSTMMLEQKLVFFSSRRSFLLGCVKSASSFIAPLEWPHLLVPVVPNDMVSHLLEYPGPFIVGITSDNPDGNDWISELQSDVTLVDLDIGRVILAEVVGDRSQEESRLSGLRSQVLYLSEELGRYIGHCISPNEWASDQALACNLSPYNNTSENRFKTARNIFEDFILELLSGKVVFNFTLF